MSAFLPITTTAAGVSGARRTCSVSDKDATEDTLYDFSGGFHQRFNGGRKWGLADTSRKQDFGNRIHEGTISVHGGERTRNFTGSRRLRDSVTTPIVQTSTYYFRDTQECIDYQFGDYESYEYGRYGNPTAGAAEEKISMMEGAEDALVSTSGMNAVTTALFALLPRGGHIITTKDCYRRTRQFIATMLPKLDIKATIIEPDDVEALEEALRQGADLFLTECPTNPFLRVPDIQTMSLMCHEKGCTVCVDSTLATPVLLKPIEFGADLVLHSGTKYLSGHNDVVAGVLAGSKDLVRQVKQLHGVLGGVIDPHAAYLLLRGMKTLDLRVKQQTANALAIGKLLEDSEKVERVYYPLLESHPDHDVAKRLLPSGAGGVLSFVVRGGFDGAARFCDALRIPYIGPSLGGVESLVEQVSIISYYDQTPEVRKEYNIADGLVRLACGIEDTSDLLDDVSNGLNEL